MSNNLKEATLPIQINTEEWRDNEMEVNLVKIEYTSYFIDSISWFVFTLSRLGTDIKETENPQLPKYFWDQLKFNTEMITRISRALSEGLPTYAHDVRVIGNSKTKSEKKEVPKVLDLSAQPENLNLNSAEGLADLLSKVLNHPLIPDELKMSVGNGITDLGGNSESLNKFANSPEVITEYLQNYVSGGAE